MSNKVLVLFDRRTIGFTLLFFILDLVGQICLFDFWLPFLQSIYYFFEGLFILNTILLSPYLFTIITIFFVVHYKGAGRYRDFFLIPDTQRIIAEQITRDIYCIITSVFTSSVMSTVIFYGLFLDSIDSIVKNDGNLLQYSLLRALLNCIIFAWSLYAFSRGKLSLLSPVFLSLCIILCFVSFKWFDDFVIILIGMEEFFLMNDLFPKILLFIFILPCFFSGSFIRNGANRLAAIIIVRAHKQDNF